MYKRTFRDSMKLEVKDGAPQECRRIIELGMIHDVLYETSNQLQDLNCTPASEIEALTSGNFWA